MLNVLTVCLMFGAAVCLMRRGATRTAALLQRGVFWCLALTVASGFLAALMVPSEGGVGGFLLLAGVFLFAGLAAAALFCTLYLQGLD